MQQQQTSEKRTYQSISRASLSPSLHANNTHVTESHRFGKKKIAHQISSQQASLLQKQNSETPANPPQNSVPKRTQNQNRQKKKSEKKYTALVSIESS
jgi:hypothetical protein